jgi:hypothetical protein
MVAESPRNRAEEDRLWDESEQEWTTKHIRWATVKDVMIYLRRATPVGMIDDRNVVSWMDPDSARVFWDKNEDFFEVPAHDWQSVHGTRTSLGRACLETRERA